MPRSTSISESIVIPEPIPIPDLIPELNAKSVSGIVSKKTSELAGIDFVENLFFSITIPDHICKI